VRQIHVVDPPLVTLPYDVAFCRALAARADRITLVGRNLRAYERLEPAPFLFSPLFYRRTERSVSAWQTPRSRQLLKGLEHGLGLCALAKLVAHDRPEIVHWQWFGLPLLDKFFLRRLAATTGLVMTVHDSRTFLGASHPSWWQTAGERSARSHIDYFIVHTGQTRDALRRAGVTAERISVLAHPPLRLVMAPPMPRADDLTRILFFGSIKRYKGVDVLVEAGLLMARERRDFVIHIVGRPYEMAAEIAARIHGAERWFELDFRYVPDEMLAGYVSAADIVVLPYRRIDASGAAAVAIGAGKPIVASAVGGFAELPMSRHLVLVEPDDAAALARVLTALVASPDARAAARAATGRLRATLPDWDGFAASCLAIYDEVRHARRRTGD
jgi:glycosyltransferase involved in cell wall biosynthesis